MEGKLLFKYSKIEIEQFAMFEENYSSDSKDIEFEIQTKFSYNNDHGVICNNIIVCMSCNNKPLLKLDLNSFFTIKPESIKSLCKDGKVSFSPHELIQFASLSYGTMRGIIFTKTLGTAMNEFILPPVYFNDIIKEPFIAEG